MNYDKIGIFIQKKRKDKNLTQKQLAEKIGVTDRAISKWERGQGCPDVSILEILSNELGCSILELLKGREIENEVIPVTEADDYIRESMKISENKFRIISNKMVEIMIIFIILLLGYLNVVQIMYVEKKYEMDFSSYNRSYRKKDELLSNNILLIKYNKGNYSNEDYDVIVGELDKAYNVIKSTKIYNYVMNREKIEYRIHDLLILGSIPNIQINTSTIIKTLKKYDSSDMLNYYDDNSYIFADTTPYLTYRYRLSPFKDYGEYLYNSGNDGLFESVYHTQGVLSRLLYLTEIIKEVGDIHE